MDDLKYWVALSGIPQLGAARFRRLESYFGDLSEAWRSGSARLREAGLDWRTAQEVVAAQQATNPDEAMEALSQRGVRAVHWNSEDYPPRLKEIHDPPPVLYYLGELLPEDQFSVAVVGTRSPTTYGREAAAALSRDLASAGITIVSGLALGIDGVAHRAALECGGRTVAVVAGGLDTVYPREHAGLFQQIQERGAVVSEHRLGVRPDARNFPRRNRLISGMTLGTLVVEAGEGSGTRWTVQQALEQDREVFCVPGSIFSPASRFTNRMIKEGAKLVAEYTDVLEELNLPELVGPAADGSAVAQPLVKTEAEIKDDDLVGLDAEESALVARLTGEPVHVDELCRLSGTPIATITSMLTLLEMKGKVAQVGSMHYVRASAVEVVRGS
jgi:DNA processing protein